MHAQINSILTLERIIENKTTRRIREAFKRHFLHYGYKKTNVDEVATELHMSKRTIYEYFTSKEDIFQHVISDLAAKNIEEIRGRLEEKDTYRERIDGLIDMIFSHKREVHRNQEKRLKDKHEREIAHKIFKRAFQDFAAELINKGFARGEITSDMSPETIVCFINAIVQEGINLQETDQGNNIEEDVKKAVSNILSK